MKDTVIDENGLQGFEGRFASVNDVQGTLYIGSDGYFHLGTGCGGCVLRDGSYINIMVGLGPDSEPIMEPYRVRFRDRSRGPGNTVTIYSSHPHLGYESTRFNFDPPFKYRRTVSYSGKADDSALKTIGNAVKSGYELLFLETAEFPGSYTGRYPLEPEERMEFLRMLNSVE